MAGHVLRSAKRVFGIPDFKHYALDQVKQYYPTDFLLFIY